MKKVSQITWNIVNSLLAGSLVFLGTCLDGELTSRGVVAALMVGLIVAITKFKEFWGLAGKQTSERIFNFL